MSHFHLFCYLAKKNNNLFRPIWRTEFNALWFRFRVLHLRHLAKQSETHKKFYRFRFMLYKFMAIRGLTILLYTAEVSAKHHVKI
jgi:hypothetical protein